MRKEAVRLHSFTHTHTHKKSGFLKTCRTLAYAVTYLKMLSAAQNYNMANRQYVKYNLRFHFCFCF